VSLGGLSKAYSAPGLRVGWIATKWLPILNEARRLKHYVSICSSAPSELLAVAVLRQQRRAREGPTREGPTREGPTPAGAHHMAKLTARVTPPASRFDVVGRNVSNVRECAALWRRFCATREGRAVLRWIEPDAGSTALLEFVPARRGGSGAEAFCRQLAEGRPSILLLPSSMLGFGDAHVRVGLARAPAACRAGLEALAERLRRDRVVREMVGLHGRPEWAGE
jgi:aspartate/methionine/tyrosine aminotransferase